MFEKILETDSLHQKAIFSYCNLLMRYELEEEKLEKLIFKGYNIDPELSYSKLMLANYYSFDSEDEKSG